ncbi:hypothetical protein QLX67_06640 [Balneolaceae bacterium ANBcel3]|nr:hypothetical protein [Balneolaceae bacterium ANBcel3]
MKHIFTIFLLVSLPSLLYAQSFSVKVNAGSTGFGLEAVMQVHETANVRLGGNFFSFSYLYESDDEFDLDADLSLGMFTLLMDYHPFKSAFRLTGGLVYNNNSVNAGLIPQKSYTVGGDVYRPEELGNLDAEFSFNKVAPYVALGFGNPFSGSRFGLSTDIGLIFQGSPNVGMEAEGLLIPSAEQAPILEDNVSWANLYPVFTLSFHYRIN